MKAPWLFLPSLHFYYIYFMSNYRESQRKIKPPREEPLEESVVTYSMQDRTQLSHSCTSGCDLSRMRPYWGSAL